MTTSDGPPATNASPRHRSTRDRPAKAPLSKDAVVDAAIGILTSEGLEAVTMRRVAASLETGAASLYVYVSGREDLLEAIHDRITAAIELEAPDPTRWREQLHKLLGRMQHALAAHPGIAATTMAGPPTTEASMRLFENMLGLLMAGGLDPREAAWAADIFAMLVTYGALEQDVRSIDDTALAGEILGRFSALPPAHFPLITAHAAELVSGDRDERFRYAIDVLIDGILAKAHLRPHHG